VIPFLYAFQCKSNFYFTSLILNMQKTLLKISVSYRIGFGSVTVFLVPVWGTKPALASGCGTGPHRYRGLWAGTRCHSRLHPPSQRLRIGPPDSRNRNIPDPCGSGPGFAVKLNAEFVHSAFKITLFFWSKSRRYWIRIQESR
jgi:hypothetical protein